MALGETEELKVPTTENHKADFSTCISSPFKKCSSTERVLYHILKDRLGIVFHKHFCYTGWNSLHMDPDDNNNQL